MLVGLMVVGCKLKPTYAGDVADRLKNLIAHDYKLNVETRRAGETLQAFFWRVGIYKSGEVELRPGVEESLEKVLLSTIRVVLSTDAPLQFLEIKAIDVLTGSAITLWRYVPDVRDSMYSRFGDEEYLNRLVVDFQLSDDGPQRPQEWKEMRWDPPMTMAQFLAKQVVQRAKRQSTVKFQAHEDVSHPERLVVVMDNWDLIQKQGMREEEKVTDLVEQTAKTVIKGYSYTGFHEFVLKDALGVSLRSRPL